MDKQARVLMEGQIADWEKLAYKYAKRKSFETAWQIKAWLFGLESALWIIEPNGPTHQEAKDANNRVRDAIIAGEGE